LKFTKTTLIICFLLATILLARKSEIFGLAFDIEKFVRVVPFWFLTAIILLLVIKFFFKQNFSDNTKLVYWTMICIFSLFHWCIVKADPNPYEPVDTSLQKNSNEKSTTSDTLELARQKIYSTIEYVQSIDTSEEGVFIRINTKRKLLRKLTEAEKNGGGMSSDLDKEAIKNLLKTTSRTE